MWKKSLELNLKGFIGAEERQTMRWDAKRLFKRLT